jgi:heme exporter protein A
MYSLKVSNISKQYAGALLFKDISFALRPGEVLGVTGWNGSGKTTLLRIIAGLVRPSLGKVEMFLENEPIAKESRRQFVGMVAPALALYDELTALENMAFLSRERFGLVEPAQKMCRTYSSGMKQRLKLVQAVLHKPPLLLLDEPGCNLDSKGMKIVEDVILEQRQSGMTVIASNEKREVDYADRVINLSE